MRRILMVGSHILSQKTHRPISFQCLHPWKLFLKWRFQAWGLRPTTLWEALLFSYFSAGNRNVPGRIRTLPDSSDAGVGTLTWSWNPVGTSGSSKKEMFSYSSGSINSLKSRWLWNRRQWGMLSEERNYIHLTWNCPECVGWICPFKPWVIDPLRKE